MTFEVYGRLALFTDPIMKMGGEKSTYQIPTVEALKGITESIYWKPTFRWVVDRFRVMNRIHTYPFGQMPVLAESKNNPSGRSPSIYRYLQNAKYQVQVHLEWNMDRSDLTEDRNSAKHMEIALRHLERGGRRDIFLGTRECQGYVEPCTFSDGTGYYDGTDEREFGLMFHSFIYPPNSEVPSCKRFWYPTMKSGVIDVSTSNLLECAI